ncbi:MAG: PAS domain S-box protein [Pseudodesulfovibrio sp.]|nr:PAS domain S-box protein [Pseudodesulfovibrio sp.]
MRDQNKTMHQPRHNYPRLLGLVLPKEGDNLTKWRGLIFSAIFAVSAVFGLFSLIPNLKIAVENQQWSSVSIYLFLYTIWVIILFVHRIPFKVRVWAGVSTYYLSGLVALVMVGPVGSGRIYLIAAGLVISLMLGLKSGLIMLGWNIGTLILIGWLMNNGIVTWMHLTNYTIDNWITSIGSFFLLSIVTTIPPAVLVRQFELKLLEEQRLIERMKTAGILLDQEIEEHKKAEEELKGSKMFLDNISDIAYTADDQGNLTWANSASERITGLSLESTIGKPFLPLFIEDDHQSLIDIYTRTLMGESLENTLTFISGITCHFTSLPNRDSKGEITGTFGVARDITERLAMERALQVSENRLKEAQAVARIGNWEYDISTGKVWGSEEAFRLYGIERKSEYLPLDEVEAQIIEAKRVNQALVDLVTLGKEYNIEYQITQKNSKKSITLHALAELVKDDEGNPIKVVGIIQNITERVQAEEALQESRNLYQKMNENSPLGMHFYQLDDNDQLVFVGHNPAADKLLGVDNSQFVGKTIGEAFPQLLQTEVPRRYRDAAAKGIPWSTEQIAYEDGKIMGASEVRAFQTTPENMVTIFADITERVQAQAEIHKLNAELEERIVQRTAQLEASNKELESFSYSVSHDLRSPLRGINGWSLALLEDYGSQLDEQAKTYLGRVRSETQRMGQLIDALLQLSRLTRDEMSIKVVDLSAIAATISTHLQKEEPQRQVEFVIEPGLDVNGDPHLLEIALTNLLGNAFKFTVKTPQARIQFGQTELAGQTVFFVRDNGAGFDMAHSKKLFGAFQRMHKTSDFPGTGIGLTTVQRVLQRHGGRIWAEAAVDKGATFYFTLEEIS